MQRTCKVTLALGLIAVAFAANHLVSQASGQTGAGWITLCSTAPSMGEWTRVGESQLANGGWRGRRGQEKSKDALTSTARS